MVSFEALKILIFMSNLVIFFWITSAVSVLFKYLKVLSFLTIILEIFFS